MLTQLLLDFTLLGAEWILWILLALSLLSIGVAIERSIFYGRGSGSAGSRILALLKAGDKDGAASLARESRGFVALLRGRRGAGKRTAGEAAPLLETSLGVPTSEGVFGGRGDLCSVRRAHEAR